MNVSLRHLRAFISVTQTGSFTAAASALFLTQSTLTKTIRELESEIGLQLFERTTRRVTLTAHGREFFPVAERLINDFNLSMSELRARSSGSAGLVNVASGLAFASTVFPHVVCELNQRYPNIHVSLLDDTSGGVVQRIEAGRVDLGIGSYVGVAKNVLDMRKILTARLGVLFPPGYKKIPAKIAGDDLAKLPILADVHDSSIASTLRENAPEFWEGLVNRVLVTNLDLQLSLVRKGTGVCIISALAASHPFAKGLPFRLIEKPSLQRDVFVFTRKGVPLSPSAVTFLSIIGEVLPRIDFVEGVKLERFK
jgi:DNA-binding transcriptional LysR family regulator